MCVASDVCERLRGLSRHSGAYKERAASAAHAEHSARAAQARAEHSANYTCPH